MWAAALLVFLPGYIPGALVVGERIRKFGQGARSVLLVAQGRFSHRQLALLDAFWDEIVPIQVDGGGENGHFENGTFASWRNGHAEALAKIELWRLPYEKVLFLDADTLPRGNIGALFAVDFAPDQILAAPDAGCPDTFNLGVFVLRPRQETYDELTNQIASLGFGGNFLYDGGDQALLNAVFNPDPSWPELAHWTFSQPPVQPQKPRRWVQMPYLYNTAAELQTPVLAFYALAAARRFGPDVQCVHFVGPRKPWHGGSGNYCDEWWAAWNEVVARGRDTDFLKDAFQCPEAAACNIDGILGEVVVNPLGESPVVVDIGTSEGVSCEEVEVSGIEAVPVSEFAPNLHTGGNGALEAPDSFLGSELCDPANYIEAFGPTPQEPLWDATREAPPLEAPKSDAFVDAITAYRSQWQDETVQQEPPSETQIEQINAEVAPLPGSPEPPSVSEIVDAVKELEIKPPETLSIFHNMTAERVFDRTDYVPQHPLLRKQEPIVEPTAVLPTKTESEPKVEVDTSEAEAEEEAVEAFEEEVVAHEEEAVTLEDEVEEMTELQEPATRLAPIFPWELRPVHAPERTFD